MQAREKRLTFDSDTEHEECTVVAKERASLWSRSETRGCSQREGRTNDHPGGWESVRMSGEVRENRGK
jgi:hypothetical protein